MTDPNKHPRWRIESEAGHVVFLYAEDLPHAKQRWREFYQQIEPKVFVRY